MRNSTSRRLSLSRLYIQLAAIQGIDTFATTMPSKSNICVQDVRYHVTKWNENKPY